VEKYVTLRIEILRFTKETDTCPYLKCPGVSAMLTDVRSGHRGITFPFSMSKK